MTSDDNRRNNKQWWLNHWDSNQPDGEELVANSGVGAKCKVEIISKSDLLRARGYKGGNEVGSLEVDVEGETTEQQQSGN